MSAAEGSVSYAAVAVPVPVRRLFTYVVEDEVRPTIAQGTRVRVPFGRRKVVGTVVEWPAAPPDPSVETRAIESVLPDSRRLPEALLELTRFVADYYLCSWGEAIEAALPPDPGPRPRRLWVRRRPIADPVALGPRERGRRRLLDRLPADGTPLPLAALEPADRRLVRDLERRGWVETFEAEQGAGPALEAVADGEPGPEPTAAQAAVLEQVEAAAGRREFSPFLLYGATGSGKTEVYLRTAGATLERGQGVLYLVPEIGLTPLLVSKVSRRFPGVVAVLHSGMPRRERSEAWEAVRQGRLRLVIGTRSAVFAPVADLGLVVVDEEQDGSYKQEETPRYNARDLAVVRARTERALLLLGSATPSMESFHHAVAGRYSLLRLGGRIERRPLPAVELIDMREQYRRQGEVSPLSLRLAQELGAMLERGEQALVLRNRRGWAAAVLCPRCGERVGCPNCSVALTWHRSAARLRCHYCDLERRFPESCATCGATDLQLVGEGTEKIEELIREVLPAARVERMDRDSTRSRGSQERLLRSFESGEIDVLVGTQMIAKGHDFPRVTVVGVLAADQPLGLPDFRAAERVFQLLTQVAGRAGRGDRPGRVLIQAFNPDHPLLRQAATQDFEGFYEREIEYRRAMRYPPLAGLVQFVIQDRDELRARCWAEAMAEALRAAGGSRLQVSGPGTAPIERLKGFHRQQILVRAAGRRRLIGMVEQALAAIEGRIPRRALAVDVDPYNLL